MESLTFYGNFKTNEMDAGHIICDVTFAIPLDTHLVSPTKLTHFSLSKDFHTFIRHII